jgi:2-oxoglutarate dehydrogenase E2 component (dihydrolipoamide succinyltransferase)
MAARVDVRAPAEESEGTRSRVLRWLKTSGEAVARDEPLIELETDKVTVEVPAPADGVLSEIFKHEQDEVDPGELLGRIDAVAGRAVSPAAQPVQPPATHSTVADAGAADASRLASANALSPAVRRLLAEHGLRPEEVAGSGSGGRITADDVLARVAARGATAPPGRAPAGSAPSPPDSPGVRRVPHSALRRRIAEHMVASLRTAPHVTTVFEADFGGVLAHRERHREAFAARGAPLTLTAYIVAACVDAIRAVPETNARWTDDALEIFERIDIGVGTALPEGGGLVVPVIRDVAALDLEGVARRLHDLTVRAREGRLSPADVRGGTFTISNHGVSGSLLAAPIVINQLQSAILGVGRLEKRAVVTASDGTDRIVARPRGYLTLTIDHRVMDGERANRFMDVLVRRLSDWPAD